MIDRDVAHARNALEHARLRGVRTEDVTADHWRALKAAYSGRCAYCGARPRRLTMDHVTPLSKGGPHSTGNIVPACGPCNVARGDGPPPQTFRPVDVAGGLATAGLAHGEAGQ